MEKFLRGERVTFSLHGQANFGVYAYASVIKMEVQLRGTELLIYKIDGDFTFREGFTSYTSKTKQLLPPTEPRLIYRGETGQAAGAAVDLNAVALASALVHGRSEK